MKNKSEKYNIDSKEMISTYSKMISIQSISPESGGLGESMRADFLENLLKGWKIKPKRYDYTDTHGVKRSNLVVKYGNCKRTVWILAHTDTVAVGDIKLWKSNPFKAIVKDGKIYGRGSQDNGQGVICGLYTLRALLGKEKSLKYNYGLVLAADEEVEKQIRDTETAQRGHIQKWRHVHCTGFRKA